MGRASSQPRIFETTSSETDLVTHTDGLALHYGDTDWSSLTYSAIKYFRRLHQGESTSIDAITICTTINVNSYW